MGLHSIANNILSEAGYNWHYDYEWYNQSVVPKVRFNTVGNRNHAFKVLKESGRFRPSKQGKRVIAFLSYRH